MLAADAAGYGFCMLFWYFGTILGGKSGEPLSEVQSTETILYPICSANQERSGTERSGMHIG